MTPREAIALQRQRPQLPSGWRVPDHPANRWEPRRAPEPVALPRVPSTVIIKPDSAPARMLALFRDLARHGHCLPYYRELSVRVGVPVKNLNAPFERLESEGLITRVVRPRPGKGASGLGGSAGGRGRQAVHAERMGFGAIMVAVVLAAIIGLWAAALVVVICDAVEDMRHERDD